jgi:hypothetical protein
MFGRLENPDGSLSGHADFSFIAGHPKLPCFLAPATLPTPRLTLTTGPLGEKAFTGFFLPGRNSVEGFLDARTGRRSLVRESQIVLERMRLHFVPEMVFDETRTGPFVSLFH